MRRAIFFTFAIMILSITTVSAQETTSVNDSDCGWYVGAEGGVPFGFGSFSSFGHDKTRAGYNVGLYGGYRFNPILSAELSANLLPSVQNRLYLWNSQSFIPRME